MTYERACLGEWELDLTGRKVAPLARGCQGDGLGFEDGGKEGLVVHRRLMGSQRHVNF